MKKQPSRERVFSWQEKVFSFQELFKYQYIEQCVSPLEIKYHQDIVAMKENVQINPIYSYVDVDYFVNKVEECIKVTTNPNERSNVLTEKYSKFRNRRNMSAIEDDDKDEDLVAVLSRQIMYICMDGKKMSMIEQEDETDESDDERDVGHEKKDKTDGNGNDSDEREDVVGGIEDEADEVENEGEETKEEVYDNEIEEVDENKEEHKEKVDKKDKVDKNEDKSEKSKHKVDKDKGKGKREKSEDEIEEKKGQDKMKTNEDKVDKRKIKCRKKKKGKGNRGIIGDTGRNGTCDMEQRILCTIKYDGHSVLYVDPDFNIDSKPYLIEFNDVSRKPYEYWVENVSIDINTKAQIQEDKMLQELYIRHKQRIEASIGHEFECPESGNMKVMIYGEIMSAVDFEYDSLFIHYFIQLPHGWSTEDPDSLEGMTQLCFTTVEEEKDIAYFSLPVTWELNFNIESLKSPDSAPHWPQLFVRVISQDSWRRQRTEGYGHKTIPPTPGSHTIDIKTWRPLENRFFPVGELRRMFVGGTPELEDITYAGTPSSFEGKYLSRFGFKTQSSGSVRIHLNILHQFYQRHDRERHKQFLLERLNSGTILQSVNTVLDAFRRAKERMAKAKKGLSIH